MYNLMLKSFLVIAISAFTFRAIYAVVILNTHLTFDNVLATLLILFGYLLIIAFIVVLPAKNRRK